MTRRVASTARNLVTSLLTVQSFRRTTQRRKDPRRRASKTKSIKVACQHVKCLMKKLVKKKPFGFNIF